MALDLLRLNHMGEVVDGLGSTLNFRDLLKERKFTFVRDRTSWKGSLGTNALRLAGATGRRREREVQRATSSKKAKKEEERAVKEKELAITTQQIMDAVDRHVDNLRRWMECEGIIYCYGSNRLPRGNAAVLTAPITFSDDYPRSMYNGWDHEGVF